MLRNAADLGLALGEAGDVDVTAARPRARERPAAGDRRVPAGARRRRRAARAAPGRPLPGGAGRHLPPVLRRLPGAAARRRGGDAADHRPAVAVRGDRDRAAQRPGRARRAPRRSGCEGAPGRPAARRHRAADGRRRAPGRPRRARPAGLAAARPSGSTASCTSAAVPVTDLAREHGTPLFVLDEADFRGRAAGLRRRLRRTPTCTTRPRRSSAARSPAGSPRTACTSTSAAATSSPLALAAGFPAERIALHGNNKSVVELRAGRRRRRRPHRARLLRRDRPAGPAGRRPGRRGRRAGAGAHPGHRRHRGAHPRVHRHRARGPEVRLLAGHRRRADRRRPGDPRAGAASSPACTPTSARRSSTPPASRSPRTAWSACSARCTRPPASCSASSTSAAASASPTWPRTTRSARPTSPPGCAPSSPPSARRWACRCRGWRSSRAGRSPGPAP